MTTPAVFLPNGPTFVPTTGAARPSRRVIYAALFRRLEQIPGVVTVARKLRPFNKVGASEQPAVFLTRRHETLSPAAGTAKQLPALRRYECDVHVYVHAASCASGAVDDAMSDLLDALEAALAPDDHQGRGGACTLGGLVSHCRVQGTIETDEGLLGDQAVAIVPIEIVPFP